MYSKNCYDSIHNCPIGVFHRVMGGAPLSLLGHESEAEALKAWDRLLDEYVREIGLPEGYRSYLNHMKRACNYTARAFQTGQKHLLNFAQVERARAKASNSEAQGTFLDAVASVSKAIGFRIDPNSVTVAEFEAYTKTAKEHGKG